jgi:peptidylprolyl isomerase
MFKKIIVIVMMSFSFSINSYAEDILLSDTEQNTTKKEIIEPKNTLYIELKDGIVIIELFPKIAPRHVQRIKELTGEGFYDGIKFHRVIKGFMAQTGDPTGTGRGGSSYGRLRAEFNGEHHTRGTLSMARAADVDTANSQFFIITGEYFPELDRQYTIFGRVIEGMEYVDKIKYGDTKNNGIVEEPDVMIKVIVGNMLNNKSIETIKKEIKIISDMQDKKLKEDPEYKKRPIIDFLVEAKNININETDEEENNIKNEDSNKNGIAMEDVIGGTVDIAKGIGDTIKESETGKNVLDTFTKAGNIVNKVADKTKSNVEDRTKENKKSREIKKKKLIQDKNKNE